MSLAGLIAHRVRRLRALRRDDVRALLWAVRTLRQVRGEIAENGTRAVVTPPPGRLGVWSGDRVARYLEWRQATCLERCFVMQSWLAAHDRFVPIVVGVGTKSNAFAAHAWLPGYDPDAGSANFREISRIEPRVAQHA